MRVNTLLRLVLACLLLSLPAAAQAEGCGFGVPFIWTGLAGTNNWNDDDNWIPTVAPGMCDDVTITPGLAQPFINGTVLCGTIHIQPDAEVTIASGGRLVLDGDLELQWNVVDAKVGILRIETGGEVEIAGDWIQPNNTSLPELGGTVQFTGNSLIVSDTFVRFDTVNIDADATVTLVNSLVQVVGDFFIASGGQLLGDQFLQFVGDGSISTGSSSIPLLSVASGTRRVTGITRVEAELRVLAGGTLEMEQGDTLFVDGQATLSGVLRALGGPGSASSKIDVAGDVLADGTLEREHPTGSRLEFQVEGDWTGASSFDALFDNFRFCFDGDLPNTLSGDLRLGKVDFTDDGVHTLGSGTFRFLEVEVDDLSILDIGANTVVFHRVFDADDNPSTVLGTGTLEYQGIDGDSLFVTADNLVPALRVVSGDLNVDDSRVASLEVLGGSVRLGTFEALVVDGDASFLGGAFAFSGVDFGQEETLEVGGDLLLDGTVFDAGADESGLFRIQGDVELRTPLTQPRARMEFVGGASVVRGPQPDLPSVEVLAGGVTLDASAARAAGVTVAAGQTLDLNGATLTFAGDLTTNAAGASINGPGLLELDFPGQLASVSGGASALPGLVITSGELDVFTSSTVAGVLQTGGTLFVRDGRTLTVEGDATFLGGILSSFSPSVGEPVLDVGGSVTIDGGTFVQGFAPDFVIRCGGSWNELSDFGLVGQSSRVELSGGASTISGTPSFPDLVVDGGPRTVTAASLRASGVTLGAGATLDLGAAHVTFAGDLDASAAGATVGGSGELEYDAPGTTSRLFGGTSELPALRVTAGTLIVESATVAALAQTGGALAIGGDDVLAVQGDARFEGGVLTKFGAGSGEPELDVDGDFVADGGSFQPGLEFDFVIRCAGDWSELQPFGLAAQVDRVELDGLAPSVIEGTPTFTDLVVKNGPRTIATALPLGADLVRVETGGSLRVDAAVDAPGVPFDVDDSGTLSVGPGGSLALDAASSIDVGALGALELHGQPASPASLVGANGGGYALSVAGTLSASNFVVAEAGPGGLVLGSTATLAAAPFDLRGGTFTAGASAAGGRLLDLELAGAHTLVSLLFEDPLDVLPSNARRASGPPISFQNFGGDLGGPAFEDDPAQDPVGNPQGNLVWLAPLVTDLASFSATPGPEEVELAFATNTEDVVDAFVIEVGPTASGPFTTLVELAPLGGGAYAVLDAGLPADVARHYRLTQRLTTSAVELLATAQATPYSATFPDNVIAVGPNGDFPDPASALAAASEFPVLLRVETGVYPAFTIDGAALGSVHVLPDGSGPVILDTTTGPLVIRDVAFPNHVELAELELLGNPSTSSMRVEDCLGAIVLDELTLHGGVGQPGLAIEDSLFVTVQDGAIDGTPGIRAEGALAKVYVGRGQLDTLELANGAAAETVQTPALVTGDGTTQHVELAGTQPHIDCDRWLTLGEPFGLTVEAEPGGVYALFASGGVVPADLGAPFWQMLSLFDLAGFQQLGAGVVPPGGAFDVPLVLPPKSGFLGASPLLQLAQIEANPELELRFSNGRFLHGQP